MTADKMWPLVKNHYEAAYKGANFRFLGRPKNEIITLLFEYMQKLQASHERYLRNKANLQAYLDSQRPHLEIVKS